MNRFLIRLNRVIAYVILALMVGVLITGYRMTGSFSFLPRGLSDSLHRIYFNVPLIVLFIAHSLISIRIGFIRKGVKSLSLDILFLVIGIAFSVFFSYFALYLIISFRR